MLKISRIPAGFCHRNRLLIIILLLLSSFTGCDPQINIYKQNDRYYSVFGFLNASAPIQFIRIEPLRDSLLTSAPRDLHAQVTVTDLTDGRSAALHDSIFTYLQGIAHNYYTTFPIKATHTYKLAITGPNGGKTTGQVTVPDSFPRPIVVETYTQNTGVAVVSISGIKRLIAVKAIYYVIQENTKRVYSFAHLADTTHGKNGIIYGNIPVYADLIKIRSQFPSATSTPTKIVVMVAAGNQDWPDFLKLNLETETIPSVATNITGGVGLLGGVVTDTVVVYQYP